jgi:hypothetical protein
VREYLSDPGVERRAGHPNPEVSESQINAIGQRVASFIADTGGVDDRGGLDVHLCDPVGECVVTFGSVFLDAECEPIDSVLSGIVRNGSSIEDRCS